MTVSADLSIVIPVMNEAESIDALAREIDDAFRDSARAWECVWVDDGSTDGSLNVLRRIVERNPRHRFVAFRAHAGQSAALWAGFRESRGALIATLDADGQNVPSDLPRLADTLEREGADMVNGYRERRRHGIVRRLASRIANGARNAMTGRTVSDVGCSTRCFRRECVDLLPPFAGMHRFLPSLVALHGYRLLEVPVGHRPRATGATKYTIGNRLWVGVHDLFGVRWIRRRAFRYAIAERSDGGEG